MTSLRSKLQPKVAVLLAAYNGMQWIEEQVDTILNQKGVQLTLFVSVDQSNDGTEQWVQRLSTDCDNVVMLPYGERFGGAGRNFFHLFRSVTFEHFDYIALADQDDIWLPKKLHRACEVMAQKAVDVVSSDVTAFWPDGRKKLIKKSQPQRRLDHFFEAAGPGCTYVFNQASALALQRFIIDLGTNINQISLHDWLAYAFCRHNGFKWYIDRQPMMLYRQHAHNQVGTNTGLAAYKKRLRLIREHWYRHQVVNIARAVAPELADSFTKPFFLIRCYRQLRRRPRDCYALLVMLLLGVF